MVSTLRRLLAAVLIPVFVATGWAQTQVLPNLQPLGGEPLVPVAGPRVPIAAEAAPAPFSVSALAELGALRRLAPNADPSSAAAGGASAQAGGDAVRSAKLSGALKAFFDGAKPPAARRDDSVADDYFGTNVSDPYRWLEDPNSAETKAFVEAQSAYADSKLKSLPDREAIRARIEKLLREQSRSTASKHGEYWFYYANDGTKDQSILYKARRHNQDGEVFLDPNALSSGRPVALKGASFSDDGRHMAYAVSESGSDWTEWRVRDVETGQDLPDVIRFTKFTGAAWTADGKGFYYARFPEPQPGDELSGRNVNSKVYYHRLGAPQGQDELVYERPDQPDWGFSPVVTDDGRYLLIYQYEGTEPKNRIFVKDLKRSGSKIAPLLDGFDAEYAVIDNDGPKLYVKTTKDAPRGRLIVVDRRTPEPWHWKELIPQSAGPDVLESVQRVGRKFVATWLSNVHSVIKLYGPRGGFVREVALPGVGQAGFFDVGDRKNPRPRLWFTSYIHPQASYYYDLETGKSTKVRKAPVDFDAKKFEVKQVFYPSKDGTRIPMFIVHKRGLRLDGTNPTYLYGYGGFGISLLPGFSKTMAAWMELGGVYAVANLRGGGEFGQEWHDAGRRHKKQNVFDDFIAAAEYLIREKITSTPKLAIGGGSNGGLLVGAALIQRPDLFGAAIPEVGVLDMLRFHKFTVGKGWTSDYLSSDTKDGFDTLVKYSPLHNVRPGTEYPPTLVMTGDHDDRVVPAHSYKFAAALQHAQGGEGAVLLRVERDAGHGAGTPISKILDEVADKWAFLKKVLGF